MNQEEAKKQIEEKIAWLKLHDNYVDANAIEDAIADIAIAEKIVAAHLLCAHALSADATVTIISGVFSSLAETRRSALLCGEIRDAAFEISAEIRPNGGK